MGAAATEHAGLVDVGETLPGEISSAGEAYWKGPPAWELLFWFLAILFHIGFMVYAAWRLAKKYTESTGTNVTIIEPVKADKQKKDDGPPLLPEESDGLLSGNGRGTKKRRPLHA